MPKGTLIVAGGYATASIGGSKKTFSPARTVSNIGEAIDMEVNVGSADTPSTLLEVSPAARGASNAMNDFKFCGIHNTGVVAAEIMIEATQYYDNSNVDVFADDAGNFHTEAFLSFVLPPGDHMILPNPRIVIYNEDSSGAPESAGNAAAVGDISAAKSITSGSNDGPTDGLGHATSSDHFGETDTAGSVPGSVVINFYAAGYQELGITNATNKGVPVTFETDSDLAVNTAYAFNIQVDGASAETIAFTTHTSDVTLGDPTDSASTGVLRKIQEALDANTNTRGVIVSIVDGDIRFTSRTRLNSSAIALAAPSSGTTMFGVGIIPAIGNVDGAVAAALEATTTSDHDKLGIEGNTDHLLLDNGNGTMSRKNGGSATIDYDAGGTIVMNNCPPHATFQIHFIYNSAHSGELQNSDVDTANCIKKIYGRSLNRGKDAVLKITAFN